MRQLDEAGRLIDALKAEAVGVAERTAAYAEDGHASVSGWVKATGNYSSGETRALVQSARLLHAVPEVRDAAHGGSLGSQQLRLLARVFANPRCADQFPDSASLLVDHASSLWFDEFAVVVRRWEALADADGAHAAHERAHTGRDAHVGIAGQRVYVDARGGVAAGTVLEEIFSRFCQAQFHADWDDGVTRWGGDDPVTPGAQRPAATLRRVAGDLHSRRPIRGGRYVRGVGQHRRRRDHVATSSRQTGRWPSRAVGSGDSR